MSATASAPLYMVQAEMPIRPFRRWMAYRDLKDADHASHCLLTEMFGKGLAPKPFRIMWQGLRGTGRLLGYTGADTDELRFRAAAYADPAMAEALPDASIATRPMPSEWPDERQLGFELRCRPIVRRMRSREMDVYDSLCRRDPDAAAATTREHVYLGWLASQFDRRGGARLCEGRMKECRPLTAFRKRKGKGVPGCEVVLCGTLQVTDGAAFHRLLADGVGRHRAYGYGMLLLRA